MQTIQQTLRGCACSHEHSSHPEGSWRLPDAEAHMGHPKPLGTPSRMQCSEVHSLPLIPGLALVDKIPFLKSSPLFPDTCYHTCKGLLGVEIQRSMTAVTMPWARWNTGRKRSYSLIQESNPLGKTMPCFIAIQKTDQARHPSSSPNSFKKLEPKKLQALCCPNTAAET